MSRMTSSSNNTNNKGAESASDGKPLTDFSIETIIGKQTQSDSQESNQRRELNSNLNLPIRSTQKSNTTNHSLRYYGTERTTMLNKPPVTSNELQDQPSIIDGQRKYRPKNFQCPACKMAFSNNGQLKNHVRIHTGERPFRCNQLGCNKTFTRNEELTRHKLIHSGVRPHACTTCGKRFGRKDHLKKHIRTHDRKRLRKRVFVPRATRIEMEDGFVPPKPSISSKIEAKIEAESFESRLEAKPTSGSMLDILPRFDLAPISLSQPPPLIPSPTSRQAFPIPHTTNVVNTTTSATTTLQQMANDYWSKWYNLIGFYHQQHFTPIDRLRGSLFRNNGS